MGDIVTRHQQNPLLSPKDLKPSSANMIIECLLNPGVFNEQVNKAVATVLNVESKMFYLSKEE